MRKKLSSELMARILGSGFASRAHSVLWLQDCEDPNPAKAGQAHALAEAAEDTGTKV